MGEIFWGVYQRNAEGYAELIGEEAVTPAENIVFPELSGVGVGSGWGVYHQQLLARLDGLVTDYHSDALPRAASIAKLGAWGFSHGQAIDVDQAMPVYLRDKVAKKESERGVVRSS